MGLCGNDPPDPSKAYAAGIYADLANLPNSRLVQGAADLGQAVTVNLPGRGGGPTTFDFTGLGQSDYQSQYADRMAQAMLDLQKKYGPEYVQQRLHELEVSDPEGVAMRSKLWNSIQSDVTDAQNVQRPVADELQNSIMAELEHGGNLDPTTAHRISQGVMGNQVAHGNFLGNAATMQEAGALADATEAQRAQRQQQALTFLTSGATPEDVSYRRQQQALGNLGSFLSGESPTAQFGQLSGAQNQIVPFNGAAPLPGVNPNAGFQGIQNAQSLYSANMNWANSTVNPWIAGLSGAVNGARTWASLGGGTTAVGGVGGGAGGGGGSPSAYNFNFGTGTEPA